MTCALIESRRLFPSTHPVFVTLNEKRKVNDHHYLVFGDLHGRILPAFRLATEWCRDHGVVIDDLLQVGDMGYFPDPARMDKATQRHAKKDPLELGAQLIVEPNPLADQVFDEAECASTLWHTLGNHEDYETIEERSTNGSGNQADFPLDAYVKVRCIRNGKASTLPGGLRVGALWGISGKRRRKTPDKARIRTQCANQLSGTNFDVLLTHDSPADAIYENSGSEAIRLLIHLAQPAFAFFGHYHGIGEEIRGGYGRTRVYHLNGLELQGRGGCAEEGSVGLLKWNGKEGSFEYLDPEWLKTFTRQNWKHRT